MVLALSGVTGYSSVLRELKTNHFNLRIGIFFFYFEVISLEIRKKFREGGEVQKNVILFIFGFIYLFIYFFSHLVGN